MFYLSTYQEASLLIPNHLLVEFLKGVTTKPEVVENTLSKEDVPWVTFKGDLVGYEIRIEKLGSLKHYTDYYHKDLLEETFYQGVEDSRPELRERLLEEALELFEALGGSSEEAMSMTNHVFHEKEGVGCIEQELRGVISPIIHLAAIYKTDLLNISTRSSQYLKENLPQVVEKDKTKPRFYKGGGV